MSRPVFVVPAAVLLTSLALIAGCLAPTSQTVPAPQETTTVAPEGTLLYIVGDGVRLRQGPGTDYPVIGVKNRGDEVRVLHGAGTWCAIAVEGDTAWVHANLVGSLKEAQGR